ncbi:MAG: glycosyltransferase family 39 protein [Acidimicrobiia bacterium]
MSTDERATRQGTDRVSPYAAVAVGAAVVLGVVYRFVASSELWFDEALSVNIARLPLSELGDALRQDGAPPLFYALLHLWTDVFGTGDVAVRAMSGVVSVATLPLAYFAGRRLGGRAVAWAAVLVLASSPYAIRYATESRMYALVAFLVLWGYLALRRALESPSVARLAVVALVTALLVYTQYWCLYVIAVVGLGLIVAVWRGPDEVHRASVRVLVAIAVGGLTFVPWLPTFLDQLAHTGTPWGDPVVPWSGAAAAMISFVGGADHAEAFLLLLPFLLLPLLAVFGRALDERRIELDLHSRPAVRWEGAAALGTLLLGLTASWAAGTAFEGRYASVVFPLFVLLVAYGLTAFGDRRVRAGVLVVVVLLGFWGAARNIDELRTQAAESTAVIRAEARPGDLVVYCPDQIGPSASRLLAGEDLRQVTFPDLARPERINWVDYRERIDSADPAVFARRVLREAGDATVYFVAAPGYNNVAGKCEDIAGALAESRPPEFRVLPDLDIFEPQGLTVYRAG